MPGVKSHAGKCTTAKYAASEPEQEQLEACATSRRDKQQPSRTPDKTNQKQKTPQTKTEKQAPKAQHARIKDATHQAKVATTKTPKTSRKQETNPKQALNVKDTTTPPPTHPLQQTKKGLIQNKKDKQRTKVNLCLKVLLYNLPYRHTYQLHAQ